MSSEISLLLITTATIAFFHTLMGPDHYLPFIVISKTKKWSLTKTMWFTTLCGLGHVGSSIILGFIGIAFGIAVAKLELWEGIRGSIITWAFTSFGLLYMVWGIWRVIKNKPHKHIHSHHDGNAHEHEHTHNEDEHLHLHEKPNSANITPWILFTIFVFGPCEPLIPIVMYPAAQNNYTDLIIVTSLFALITIGTMLSIVVIAYKGINFLPTKTLEKYSHAMAGGTIFLCGLGMLFLGL